MPNYRLSFITLLFLFCARLGLAETTTAEPAADRITLDDAIQRALAKNFSIKVSGYDAAIAAAGVTQALGKFDPVINGSYNYSSNVSPGYTDPNTGAISAPVTINADNYSASLDGLLPWGMTYQLGGNTTNTRGTFNAYADNYSTFGGITGTQPLLRNFGFGSTLASIRIAQANHNISEWQFRQTVIDTITQVIFAYNDLNFAYAYQRSAIRSRDLAAQLLRENETRFRVGNMSEFDVTSARSRAASREEGIFLAAHEVSVAENALKQLILDDKSPGLIKQHLEITPPPPAPIVVVDPAADFPVALGKRPDYQEASLGLKRDSINARHQRNQLLPRVDLVGSYGYNGNATTFQGSRQQVKDQDFRNYSWGVVVSVPLTFTTERGRYRAARLQQRQSESRLDQVEQRIVVLLGNAADQIENGQKRVQATRKARELAQTTLDAEVKRLRAGQSSTFFVSQQQEILTDAEVREASALSDYAKALAEYDRQLGLTLEKYQVRTEPPKL